SGGARPSGATVPRLDAATRAKGSGIAAPNAVPRPTPARLTPAALLSESRTPPVKPRSMMATQLGVAPPPTPVEPPATTPPRGAALANVDSPLANVDSPLANVDSPRASVEPALANVDPALAKTALGAPGAAHLHSAHLHSAHLHSAHSLAAFADTQLAVARPQEVAALLDALDDDAPTVVRAPDFAAEFAPPTQA